MERRLDRCRELRSMAMQTTFQIQTTVLPGNRVEFSDPELPEETKVEVTVVVPEQPKRKFASVYEFLQTLPPGPRAFDTWEEYEDFLRKEKDSWE
jgi:hypothetical protein